MLQKSFRFFAAAVLLCFSARAALCQTAPHVNADQFSALPGVEFNTVVGSMYQYPIYGPYSVTINWGDGQTSAGSLAPYGNGAFDVVGDHTYAAPGSYVTTITVVDGLGGVGWASGTALVPDGTLTATGLNLSVAGKSFSGVVATFADSGSPAPASSYSATIRWGDGKSSTGTITAMVGGGYSVSGAHTYKQAGTYTVTIAITDVDGTSATAWTTLKVTTGRK